jgi:RecA-family ATPase
MPEIIKQCEGKNYALIIPDPIYCMIGERNENAANEMADFLNHVSLLSEKTGAAAIYTHHFAKGNASKKARQLSGVVYRGAARSCRDVLRSQHRYQS